ncbi:MAG: transglutaminase-like domain-containing protein [Pirellulaceae bacterium]|nr:transglutaminase-like domain-containing protein [Pirellulaceae bacterium]HJN13310.1 transglutaminase-like domain-containing protein [Pirellulaceae bacterium]
MLNGTRKERRIALEMAHTAVVSSLFVLATVSLPGCQPGKTNQPVATTETKEVDSISVQGRDAGPQAAIARETWDAILMAGTKVGHTQTRYETLQEGEQPLVRITAVSEMSMKRFDQTVEQKITVTSVEHPDGRLVRFSSLMGTPPNETATTGQCEDRLLRLTTTTPGKSDDTLVPWNPTWRGVFGPEQSLQEMPMRPGQKRKITTLIPLFNMIGEIDFLAIDYEVTELLSGERSLLRIESRTRIGETSIDSILWTDEQGETLKTSLPSLNQVTYRTTREIALRPTGDHKFDLGESSVVKIGRPLVRPHLSQNIVYRATIQDGDPAKTFPPGATQAVKRLDEHSAEIAVQALRPETADALALAASVPPTAEDLEPSNLIQSDDPTVVAIAGSVAKGQTKAWLVAQALERRVQDLVQVTEFSQAIASAAEVAQTKQGDCTEHAMLLAATCRARKIPARVAIGLVYYGQAGGFAYHMWTEVWIDRHWIPLDATLGQGGIGAAHLKVADSNLAGASGYAAILPVFEVMGRLKLEIVIVDGKQ